jgi:hypothetical protein
LMVVKISSFSRKIYVESRKKFGLNLRKPTVQRHSFNCEKQNGHPFPGDHNFAVNERLKLLYQ